MGIFLENAWKSIKRKKRKDGPLLINLVELTRKIQMTEMKNLKNLQHKSGIYQLWTNQISETAKRIPNRNWKVFQILVVKTFKVNKMAKTTLKKRSKRSPSKRKKKKLRLK